VTGALPPADTLALRVEGDCLHVTLDRPAVRNALNPTMIAELAAVFDHVRARPGLRIVVLRGAGGHLCAGGDLAELARAATTDLDAVAASNRRFGALLQEIDSVDAIVIAIAEGSVMGGGVGLLCVTDLALSTPDARFRLPEAAVGLLPAQVAPFLARRVGHAQARRLALTGATLDAPAAAALGLVHEVVSEPAARLEPACAAIRALAPGALAATKALLRRADQVPVGELLDQGARAFAAALAGAEGREGTAAFTAGRRPRWAEPPP
jgi:isohexenylglutaconyl-CoA hydratase